MCSIFGFIASPGRQPNVKTLQQIVRANSLRGPHAFGFAWIDRQEKGGRMHCYKQTGRLVDQLSILALARDARVLIGHLRYATHGDATANINNHPHPADSGWIVHNGVVRNYDELLESHDLLPVSQCDSEAIGLLIEQSAGSRLVQTAEAIDQTTGPLAMLGLWSRPATLIAARRGNPLHIASAAEGIYIGTLAEGLPGRPQSLRDNTVTRIVAPPRKVIAARTKLRDDRDSVATRQPSLYYRGG